MKELNAVQMPCLIGDLSLLLPMINDIINICVSTYNITKKEKTLIVTEPPFISNM